MAPAPPVACSSALLQQVAQCSGQGKQNRPSRGKVQLCDGGDQTPGERPKSKDQGTAVSKEESSSDCCGSAKVVQNASSKPKTHAVCHETKDKFAKDTKDQEETCETSEAESDKECSSEEEDAKAPTKECSDEEDDTSSCSDEDEKPGKAASEMCDCVKTAVAKAVDQKAKEGGKPPQQYALGKPGPCNTTDKEPPKPKASEHVRCCNVEKGNNVQSGGKSAGEKCREDRKALDKARSLSQSTEKGSTSDTNKGAAKGRDEKNPCDCIKQALEKCKKGSSTPKTPLGKQPEKKKPEKKQPDSAEKKPIDKPDKRFDDKKPSKKNKNKPDPKKPAPKSKHCEKKKKPVVVCK